MNYVPLFIEAVSLLAPLIENLIKYFNGDDPEPPRDLPMSLRTKAAVARLKLRAK